MRITGVKTYKFSVPTGQETRDERTGELLCSTSKPWLFLKMETDAGITGWGEGTGEWLLPAVEATLHDWESLLIGQDPLRFDAVPRDVTDRILWKGGPVFGTAAAAINMACYDIAGKAWGVPVHTILGGKRRDRVRVYSGGQFFKSPEDAVANARRFLEMGYAGIKGNPLEDRSWPMDASAIDHCVSCIAAIREALGSGIDIMLDVHASPQAELSIEFARQVAPYQPLFLEAPVKHDSIEALVEVSRKSPVPIAHGEAIFRMCDVRALIDRRACAFLQPDIGHCFGITAMMDIAKAAEQSQMLMAPHGGGGAICYAANVNANSAMDNFLIQESPGFEKLADYAEHDWVLADGYVNVPDRPGLGIEVKEQDIAKLPYEPLAYRQYRHVDGSWKGW